MRSLNMMQLIQLFALIAISVATASAEEVKVLSYNVRHATDFDGKAALERQAEVINQAGASVIGLQEIDENCQRSGSIDQTAKFAKLTNSQGTFGSFMKFNGGRYGLAAFSKLPIKQAEVVRLPEGREPRVAVVLEVETTAGHRLLVANVHFDWTTEELRVPQAKALLAYLAEHDLPTIVLGDYNAEPGSETLSLFEKAGFRFLKKDADNRLTWNARRPTVEIDHVAVSNGGGVQLIGKTITVLPEANASDHRPVAATIELKPMK